MEHLQTFETAANYLGIDSKKLPLIEGLEEGDAKAIVSTYKLFIISKAAWKAEGKKIDWNDDDQCKYYPWFDMEDSSGSGFSYIHYGCDYSLSFVGSRLVFPSSKIARYVGETHLELFRDLMVIQ